MNMSLSAFLAPIDEGEIIRITDHNSKRTMFEGKKAMYESFNVDFNVDVVTVWTSNGRIIIEVA